ncbi:MAG: hypothetical protein EOO09_02800 [Chitinophagaceae bacterium]|nr:MAG: hypothetical protein EOO09_02800 [Chitinophagaceae bacterium]
MNWLTRRLGCSGRGRLRLLESLRGQLAPAGNHESLQTGLGHSELCRFAQQYRLHEIATAIPHRGDVEDLMVIAWFGSAIADLGCYDSGEKRDRILQEGALFNLAVALFDTVMDEMPAHRDQLKLSVNIPLIRGRLWNPLNPDTRLTSRDPAITHIAALFDALFVSLGSRVEGNSRGRELSEIISLFSAMYNGGSNGERDPFRTKVLPVLFLGRLNYSFRNYVLMEDFYCQLGKFIQLYDDWLDMARDALQGKPNYFLNHWTHTTLLDKPLFYLSFGVRLLGGSLFHRHTTRTVTRAMNDAIEASRFADPLAYQRNLSLCSKFVLS